MVVVVVEVVVVEWDRRSGKGGKKIDGLLSPSNEYQSINQSIDRTRGHSLLQELEERAGKLV